MSAERAALHAADDGYWATMPDIVIEVASKTDSWMKLKAKIDKYVADGAGYALAIEPDLREFYECGPRPAGLALDIDAIIDA